MIAGIAEAIIIGAGPSGLLAAYLLAQQRYQVTVLEKKDKIDGRLKADAFSNGSTLAASILLRIF